MDVKIFLKTHLQQKQVHDKHKEKECMKKFCESLREHEMEIVNFKKEKMKLLTNKKQKSYQNAKACYIYKGKIEDRHVKDKNYHKVRDMAIIQEKIEVPQIAYEI